jgi:hypothetical protein
MRLTCKPNFWDYCQKFSRIRILIAPNLLITLDGISRAALF